MSVSERHQRERSARRDTILQAAARVFTKHGLEHATIAMIAREAEIAVGTIYLYFTSRDDLFLALTRQRFEQLRAQYSEIQKQELDPLSELRTMAQTYIEHLHESRELFLTQQSVGYAQIKKRLHRLSEIEHFNSVMELGHEVFDQWAKSVARVYDIGLIPRTFDSATSAAVLWASLNGAFLLTGQENVFQEFTGLNPSNFVERAFAFHLQAARALAEHPTQPAKHSGTPSDLSTTQAPAGNPVAGAEKSEEQQKTEQDNAEANP
ncbi:MAG TPA: TetR/AcrR family transcriptional regulator [Candidatus Binataceae bacterium]|nr:TetR/AcrR family transcriptional regulator [Candidatus Binataceae bacterium]